RGVCVQFGIGHGRPRRAGPARAARHRRDLRAPRPRRTIGQDAFEVRPLLQPAVPAHRTPPDRGAPPHTGIEHQFDTDRLAPLTDSPPSRDDEGGLMAWDMAVVSAFVRAARKPTYTDAARFRAHLEAPKPDGAPPLRLRRRHRVQIREIDGFRCGTVTPRGGAAEDVAVAARFVRAARMSTKGEAGQSSAQLVVMAEICAALVAVRGEIAVQMSQVDRKGWDGANPRGGGPVASRAADVRGGD